MELEFSQIIKAFSLTLFAGLATGIGSFIALFAKRTNKFLLCFSLGFSAGVMIYVSFVEIFPKASEAFTTYYNDSKYGMIMTTVAFFTGIFIMGLLDRAVPEHENPHEMRSVEDMRLFEKKVVCENREEFQNSVKNSIALSNDFLDSNKKIKNCTVSAFSEGTNSAADRHLLRVGFFAAIAIAIHNFPEGLATFTAGLKSFSLGVPIAIAIAIHNIPEGIAVAVPIFYSTGNRKKAFIYSFLSGMSEPLGALIGFAFLSIFFNDVVFGFVFASVAGMMVYISLDELLPGAHRYGKSHIALYGLICGMLVMALSLLLFA